MLEVKQTWSIIVEYENKKIFSWGLPGANFLFLFGSNAG